MVQTAFNLFKLGNQEVSQQKYAHVLANGLTFVGLASLHTVLERVCGQFFLIGELVVLKATLCFDK